MNKATEGAIAAGAAGILLAGGAGTFALWTATDSIDAGTVSTGKLDMLVGDGTWADGAGDLSTEEFAAYKIVPGDTLTYNTTVTVSAVGDNLSATLEADESALEASSIGDIDVSVLTTPQSNVVTVDENGLMTFPTAATYIIDVEVTVTFDSLATGQENATVDLGEIALSLDQV